jgi:two-component system, response regulator
VNGSSIVDILLVEDNFTDTELTLRALRKAKVANPVHTVEDGAAALEFLLGPDSGAVPRVVLLDLQLPKVNGLEVLRRIKTDERTRTIPVVILTSSREERDLVESYHLGANSYIVKPVDSENFAEAVSKLGMYWLLMNQLPADLTGR